MPLPPALARWLARQGRDAVHAAEIGMDPAPDTAIIEHAKDEGRTVVTADLDDPRLRALSGALEPSPAAADMDKAIFVVDRDRIRRRSLPIG